MHKDGYRPLSLDEDGVESIDIATFGQQRKPKSRITKPILSLLGLTLLLLVLGLGLVQHHEAKRGPADAGLLNPQAFWPTIPRRLVRYQPNPLFLQPGSRSDRAWDGILPLGAGYIRIPSPRRFDMPSSLPIEDDPENAEVYAVSVAHQLHCLAMLRNAFIHYQSGSAEAFTMQKHVPHCLDYLRQALLCAGDTTIEPGEVLCVDGNDDCSPTFTGEASQHYCRDWGVIHDHMEANRVSDQNSSLKV